MDCVACGSAAVTERPECTARGYRRFRCRDCGRQYNERSGTLLNHAQYPSDIIALVVLWRLRYRLTLRDLAEMFLLRGFVFSHEAVRDWEARLAPALAGELRRRRHGRGGARGRHWHVDETYLKDRKSTRLNSSHGNISDAVFCLKTSTLSASAAMTSTFSSAAFNTINSIIVSSIPASVSSITIPCASGNRSGSTGAPL